MTETSGEHTELIRPDVEEIYSTQNYAGCGDQAAIMFGPECEFFICKKQGHTLKPIGKNEANDFMALFERQTGTKLHQEAIASHFELNYGPMNLENFRDSVTDYFSAVQDLYRIADREGYRVIPSSHAPHIKGADDVIDQLADRERIKTIVPTGREYMGDNLVKFANLTAGIHVSSAYKDMDQFSEDLFRSYCLSPFIYALSNNGFPFWDGLQPAGSVIPRMAAIEIFANEPQGRTGIDPLFYRSVNGEKFLKNYISRTIHDPMLGYYPKISALRKTFNRQAAPHLHRIEDLGAAPDHPVSFNDLQRHKLNTVANLQFAASTEWFGVKIQDIPGLNGENGIPLKRLEDRIWNAGTWQIATAILTRALMRLEPECGREVDALLAEFGFSKEGDKLSAQSAIYLREATDIAWRQGGTRGLDIPYGKGTAQEFGTRYTAIMQKYAALHGLEDYLEPMAYIAETNLTDGRILHQVCETAEDVISFITSYNVNALPTPFACFGQLRDQGDFPDPAGERKRTNNPKATPPTITR
ncbi:MAG: hypothetical protein H6867_03380 [Rhodospirillales bacterium]|nr:hypothetical protein [Rhodospirillales bacterium]MCB9996194.1 hypothetical protein [Rhodospirillales bacterium]